MNSLLQQMKEELTLMGDAALRESAARFFKEDVQFHGIKSQDVRKIGKKYYAQLKKASKSDVFALCTELWRSGIHEETGIACEWAYNRRAEFVPEDGALFEEWLERYVSNWAACDTLCNHTLGTFVEMYPDNVQKLKDWTASPNRWKKRGAAVTLIIPARNGLFLQDIFDIADRLLMDEDDLVQKGYGWMLKAASEAYPDEVFAYLIAHKESMPRTAFRYALEKFPKEQRAIAMKK